MFELDPFVKRTELESNLYLPNSNGTVRFIYSSSYRAVLIRQTDRQVDVTNNTTDPRED